MPPPPPQIQFPFYGSVFRAFSGNKVVTVSKQECFGLERIGIFPIVDSLYRLPFLRLSLPLKPGFHMIVGDRSQSLGSQEKCSAIVTIIWKPNFHFASDRQRSQRLPTIATITIAGIESESISAIVAILNDRQRSQKVNGNHIKLSTV